ncbi:FtsK/SpoIIIE domain-containing protein [Candidatus Thiothrix sp. Deng01]|uniref:FtsK/SpoIIIE domain-containing protein n=1 Tax=Candidatus Thiothrix phosphatis TaxID=3112415 RepID=A0ABU6CYS6_9GAMM|nr:FtsK/SpoIIIE domain-containing protein [Candidatus Thiothrix sp. Deng01]MEB4591991.1 FtsK/SpoIIIE domain-containing protein [Candidatus Thiothrix sp. Deng01]
MELMIGKFNPAHFAPETLTGAVSIGLAASLGLFANAPATAATALTGMGLYKLWKLHRTRWLRDGYLFDSPYVENDILPDMLGLAPGINELVTERLRMATGNDELTAFESASAQYRLLTVSNNDPQQIAKVLPRIASVLGIAPEELGFIPTAGKDKSIILAPLPREDWQAVPFDESALQPRKLMGYIGQDVLGKPVTYDRKDSPHMLISGTTGAGKTEAIRADMHSMRLSGLKPEIHIIDAKATLRREQCASFTADMREGLEMLGDINQRARERMQEIVAAGCDNWFQYRKKRPEACPAPIFIYIDEYPQFRALAGKEAVEAVVGEILRVHRSAGVFLTIGIQKPKATEFPTEMRDMLDVRLAMRVPDSKASEVAIDTGGAEGLPGEGAFMFRAGGSAIVRGRGAFLAQQAGQPG